MTDTALHTDAGFTLSELRLSLFAISTITLLVLTSYSRPDPSHIYFMNDYLLCQSEALSKRTALSYQKGITFNSMGHVNMGMTLHFGRHELIVHLGNGYATLR